ncbi:3-isopropylmalate dehydrogenase [Allostella sp. ATCC 35155]|nr:3-isopropylmalate dehydrogenase [Stella sp. ATCC 35155]
MSDLRICVLPGDGIGVEVAAAAGAVLDRLQARFGFRLAAEEHPGGAAYWRETGREMPQGAWEAARSADAILFGAMGLPDVRWPDGTEIAPHLQMRVDFQLYAGVRPVRRLPNTPAVLASPKAADIDLVIIRELTEGLFASRGKGVVIDDREARDTLVITRATSEKLFDFAFDLARRRKAKGGKGLVTCVDKANVFVSMAFFRKVFDERAANHPDIAARHHYVDAAALDLVKRPWDFDVMVMENMFADILSDVGGGIVGGMGLAPSAEIGLEHALFQPAHGSAPDIAGRGIANPTAMLLSTAMMLEWLGHRHGQERLVEAADALDAAVERAFADGAAFPVEIGGSHGTEDVTRAVMDRIA